MNLLQMSLVGGTLILFIAAVRALALNRLPKATFLLLWEVAALRLLLPLSIRLPFSIPAPIEHLTAAGEYLAEAAAPTKPMSAGVLSPAPAPTGVSTQAVLSGIWLAGAVLMAAYFLACYVRAKRRFRVSCPDDTPAVQSWLISRKLLRRLEVRQSDQVSSPLTYGILRPVILLPKNMERGDETALTYILTHELVHIRRFDAAAKLAFVAVLCVHWFNPLAWVMYVLANRDLELSCDECVMSTLGGKEKAPYALTLIAMAEARSGELSIYNHFSKLAIEERIEAIMKYKKASILAMALAVALVLGATTAFAASVQTGNASPEDGQDGLRNAWKAVSDSTLMSYVNPDDGKTYYSWDGGQTFEPMTDEELNQRLSPKVEWWTYEEYAAWLENEKVELQAMLGEKGWTGGRGEFVWTQEVIDETIAMYEKILQEIKAGKLYSKSVDGDDSVMISSGGSFMTFKDVDGICTSKNQGGLDEDMSSFQPNRTEEEWQQIIADIESGKIPPLELLDDPNVTVGFADYVDGNCVVLDKVDAVGHSVPTSNVVCFDTQEQLDEHLRALEANEEKGLNRYAGFEDMYAGVDTSVPVTYVVN